MYKVHKHVYIHANRTDRNLLFEQNDLWSDDVKEYVVDTIENFTRCGTFPMPKLSRKASISFLYTFLSEIRCIDYFCMELVRVIYCMGNATCYSAVLIV